MINNQTGFAGIVVDMQTDFLKDFQLIKREEMIIEQLKAIGELQGYGIPMFVLEYKDHGETEERIRDAICYLGKIEPIIKEKESGFSNKHLEKILDKLNARNIILMGINSSACVIETAKGAKQRKYQVISAETIMGDTYKIDNELQVIVKNIEGSTIKESLDWYNENTYLFANSERLCNYVKENISK